MVKVEEHNLEIFDTTLRDGAQSRSISFSIKDKINIVRLLDDIGVHYIEAGNPGSNPKDIEFFSELERMSLKTSRIVAFGSTRKKGVSVDDDENFQKLLKCYPRDIAIFGKSWDFHVTDIIKTTLEENKAMISDSIRALKEVGKEVIFDAEHFFDGYKNNSEYAMEVLQVAVDAGAVNLALCDTNGGCFPGEIAEITRAVRKRYPNTSIGIHAHNDMELAVANSHAAIDAGASSIQGTFIGFGERCGNTNLASVIGNLALKQGVQVLKEENLKKLTETAKKVSEISNLILPDYLPYVGKNAFSHKGGMHIDGVLKASHSFEHVDPSSIGNERNLLISEVSGKSALMKNLNKLDSTLTKNSYQTKAVMAEIKNMEQQGYQYELAEGSLELLINKVLNRFIPSFDLEYYEVRDMSSNGIDVLATLKIRIYAETRIVTCEGKGPVHALDRCLRMVLEEFYPEIKKMNLEDYNVRVLDSDEKTDAGVRVVIETRDGDRLWKTMGVSHNIIEASLIALTESFEYKLMEKYRGK